MNNMNLRGIHKIKLLYILFPLILITSQILSPFFYYAENIDFSSVEIETIRVNGLNGEEPDSFSQCVAISGDGRYVAFESDATNMVIGDTNEGHDIFVFDRESKVLEMISYGKAGNQLDFSYYPDISYNGRYVTFIRNLAGYGVVHVRDRKMNKTYQLKYENADIRCHGRPLINDDGRYIIYWDNYGNIYRYDRGADGFYNTEDDTIQYAVKGSNPSVNGNGRYIAYNKYEYRNGYYNFYVCVYDMEKHTETRVDVTSSGDYANEDSYYPEISADGRFISFESYATNLIDDKYKEDAFWYNIFVHDRDPDEDGVFDEPGNIKTTLVNKSSDGTPANGWSGNTSDDGSAISDCGQYVLFWSQADNLVPGDTNDGGDLFIHDIKEEKTIRANVSSTGAQMDNTDSIYSLDISGDNGIVTTYCSDSSVLAGSDSKDMHVFISEVIGQSAPVVTIQSDVSLTESNLEGATIHLNILNDKFFRSPSVSDFVLNNAPAGVSITGIGNVTGNSCDIILEFDGTDFDNNYSNFNITVPGQILTTGDNVTSNNLIITGQPEPGVFQFSNSEYSVQRSDDTATLTINRINGSDGSSIIQYTTISETAIDGVDFVGAHWETVSFEDGETQNDITIDLLDNPDSTGENISFLVRLYEYESPCELGTPYEATVTIEEQTVGDTTPPLITGTLPQDGAFNVLINTNVEIQFNETIQESQPESISIKDQNNSDIDFTYEIVNSKLILNPANNFIYNSTYTVTVPAGTVQDFSNNEYQDSYVFQFTTESKPVVVDAESPQWPTGSTLTVSNCKTNQLTLSWTEATDNEGVVNYQIKKDGEIISTVSADRLSFNVDELSSGTTYTFGVEAQDAAGNLSDNGPTCSVSTLKEAPSMPPYIIPKDTQAPTWSDNAELKVLEYKTDGITLQWSQADDNRVVTTYVILKNGKVIGKTNRKTRSYRVTGLTPGTWYFFTVQARDAAGNVSSDNLYNNIKIKEDVITLSVAPQRVVGGDTNPVCTLSLASPAKNDMTCSITSDNTSVKLPASVEIKKGTTNSTFTVETFEVKYISKVNITADFAGKKISSLLEVIPPYEYILKDLGSVNESTNKLDINNMSINAESNNNNVTVGSLKTTIEINGIHPATGKKVESNELDVYRGYRYCELYGTQELGTFGGLNSTAVGINDFGYMVGWAETDDVWVHQSLTYGYEYARHAFIAGPGLGVFNPGQMIWVEVNSLNIIDLGTLGGRNSTALSINNKGHVVGISDIDEYTVLNDSVKIYTSHAFVYTPKKGMRDLNYLIDPTLQWELDKAYEINDKGQITAEGIVDGQRRKCILTPRNQIISNKQIKSFESQNLEGYQ